LTLSRTTSGRLRAARLKIFPHIDRPRRRGKNGRYLPAAVVGLDGGNARYDFGENRVATVTLLTITTLPGRRSCGTAMAKFSGHAVTFRSSPTVFADTQMPGSACTRIFIWQATESYLKGGNAFRPVFHLGFPTRLYLTAD